jgi:hypothetical protein
LYNSVVENAKKKILLSGKLTLQKSEKEIQTAKKEFLILDSLIDSTIYRLYNLTPEEIRTVEGQNE